MTDSDMFFKAPPRGISISTATKGLDVLKHYTYMCDQKPDCWAVGYGLSEQTARDCVAGHACPASMRLDTMPTGKSVIQKNWDELDNTIDAIRAGVFPTGDLWGLDYAKGYANALAMTLAFMSIPYFRTQRDILIQAERRRKMRVGEIPWEPTPGYNFLPAGPMLAATFQREEEEAGRTSAKPVSKATRAPVRKLTQEPPAPKKVFTDSECETITAAMEVGTEVHILANLYKVSTQEIIAAHDRHKAKVTASVAEPIIPLFDF
jgi:hypothetical protein